MRDANRDLFGDIIISSGSSTYGFAGYDELSAALHAKFPEVQAATPVVETYALLYAADSQQTMPSLLVGVRPDQRSEVTQFRQSLFQQYKAPMKAVEALAPYLPATREQLITRANTLQANAQKARLEAIDRLQGASREAPPP